MTHTCLFTSFGSIKLGWSGVLLKRHFVTLWNADMLQCIQTNRRCTLATCWCINNSCLTTFFLILGLQTCQPWRACCIYTSKIIRHALLLYWWCIWYTGNMHCLHLTHSQQTFQEKVTWNLEKIKQTWISGTDSLWVLLIKVCWFWTPRCYLRLFKL